MLPATFSPETPADLFRTLLQAIPGGDDTDTAVFYRILGETLRLAAEQLTAFHTLTLGGLYAKIDFLCQEHRLPRELRNALNAARVNATRPSTSRPTRWRRDLEAVCRFIAAIYATDIPCELSRHFPTTDDGNGASRSGVAEADGARLPIYLRVVVERWKGDIVTVRSEERGTFDVALRHADTDWTYLYKIIREGSGLNLVRPFRTAQGKITAELIIYEPDFLVDVTSVAGCFEEFSHNPFLHLLHKLSPPQQSCAILLGNLASQMLDEEVHGVAHDVSQFIADNALALLALQSDDADFDLQRFLDDAHEQQQNIRTALHHGLTAHVGNYNPSNIMLEPSFVSEMLGLQGRMDFLQSDHCLLIEQKSGRGAYQPGHSYAPRQQLKHYVQMLLYMATLRYNFSRQYVAGNSVLQAFLLYSKYPDPLLGLGAAPQLLFEAIRVRNGLVWYEEFYAKGGVRTLERITPDALNHLSAHGPLWEKYQRPQLEALLAPIHQATPLERDYYFRLLQFVTLEQRMAKVGNNTAQANSYASKWFLSLQEKIESGEIYHRLTLHHATTDTVCLTFPPDLDTDTSNFRQGDIVILYPYPSADDEPDCRTTTVHRGTLTDITPDGITVTLRAQQTDATIFTRHAHLPWAVEHDSIESAFTALYSGIHAFLSAPRHRRDLLLLQRPPHVDPSIHTNGHYGDFSELATRVKQAQELFLIIGPPGTGKTSYGMLYTLKEQLTEPSTNVLLLSYTNRAVDEICSKLVEEGIDFIRIGSPHNCDPAYHSHLLKNEIADLLRRHSPLDPSLLSPTLRALRNRVCHTRVIVGTTTTMSAQHALFRIKTFDLAIIDEASQILEPHLLSLLSMTAPTTDTASTAAAGTNHAEVSCALRKIVMIGDHKQLPAVVQQSPQQSAVSEPSLRAIGLTDCRASLFERLLRRYADQPAVAYMLHRQGRMHRDIAAFPSQFFYNNRLDIVPLPHQTDSDGTPRIVFIPADAPLPAATTSDKVNPIEARIIAQLITDISHRSPNDTIGAIVPYRNQIAAIRNLLPHQLRHITIDTVERYQGSQRDHIIYGFTIQKRYQLAFLTNNVIEDGANTIDRKLNVAMTRARKHLYIVGNPHLLAQNRTFARLMDFCHQQHSATLSQSDEC